MAAFAPPRTYYVRVVAVNTFGGIAASNEMVLTVSSPCEAPTSAPTVSEPTVSGSLVTIEWTPANGNVTSYAVEAGFSSGASDLVKTVTTATTVSANAGPVVAYIRVRPVNACGVGPSSNEVVALVPAQ